MLVKNTLIIGLGYIIPALANLLTLPIYTAALTNEEYGFYDLVMVLTSLLTPIMTLKLDAALFRYVISERENKNQIRRLVSTIFIVLGISNLVFFGIFIFFIKQIGLSQRVYMALYVCLSTIYNTIIFLARGLGKNKLYTNIICVQTLSILITTILCVKILKLQLVGVLLSLNISTLIAIIYGGIQLKVWAMYSIQCFSLNTLKELLTYSMPMVPNSISMWIVNMSDRVLIAGILGIGANGIYAIANKFPLYLSQVMGVVNTSWQENAAMYVDDADADSYFSGITITTLNILLGLSAILLALIPILFKLLVHQEYDDAYNQVPILILSLIFSCMTNHMASIYLALKKTKIICITSLTGAFLNIVINILLIGRIGLYAASVSTFFSFMVVFFVRVRMLKSSISLKIPWIRLSAGMGVMVGLSVLYYQNTTISKILCIVFAFIFAVTINKNLLKIFLTKL